MTFAGASCYCAHVAEAAERHVTRDVEPARVRDLLARPPRATVAFVRDGQADALPARARSDGDRHLFAVAVETDPKLADHEVVLVIDDGAYWFQLRGISVRGVATPTTSPDRDDLAWYAIAPRRVLAWDYGALRDE